MAQVIQLHKDEDFTPVSPLFHAVTSDVMGYQIGGHAPGPEVLVIGYRAATAIAFHRLAQLPSLPFLLGRLTVAYQEAIDDETSGIGYMDLFNDRIYGSLFIGYDATEATTGTRSRIEKDTYWSVLRLCAKLGMISGRGVPPAAEPTENPDIHEDMISPSCSLATLSRVQRTVVRRLRSDQTRLTA